MSLLLLILGGAGHPLTGLGIDWGSAYSDGTFIFMETMDDVAAELSIHTDNSANNNTLCVITSRRLITRKGTCFYFSNCKVGQVVYFVMA